MRSILFYKTNSEHCPIEKFLDSLSASVAKKVVWVLKIVEEMDIVPKQYFKKLVNTDEIWEIRVQAGNKTIRLLGFFAEGKLIILTNGFYKKTQKTPLKEIKIAEKRKKKYIRSSLK